MLIIGDKEIAESKVAERARGKGDIGSKEAGEFISQLKKEIDTKGKFSVS